MTRSGTAIQIIRLFSFEISFRVYFLSFMFSLIFPVHVIFRLNTFFRFYNNPDESCCQQQNINYLLLLTNQCTFRIVAGIMEKSSKYNFSFFASSRFLQISALFFFR